MTPVLERNLRFELPPELEAHQPPEARGLSRDGVRLLVTERASGAIHHAHFTSFPEFLREGDLVVLNDSGTLPAEVTARRKSGVEFPLRLSTRLHPDLSTVEARGETLALGEKLHLPGDSAAELISPYAGSKRLWIAHLDLTEPYVDYLLHWGRPIRYSYVPNPWPLDAYQTVYHRALGSAEMASAGRPISEATFAGLRARGVQVATLTLDTGVSSLEKQEAPYPESFKVPASTIFAIRRARAGGGRIIAVGTTVVRALESAVDDRGELAAIEGWTDLVVTPQRGVRAVDGLLTGFHEPEASHLAMLEAIAGRDHLTRAYGAALVGRYLWHEFGDVHLIL